MQSINLFSCAIDLDFGSDIGHVPKALTFTLSMKNIICRNMNSRVLLLSCQKFYCSNCSVIANEVEIVGVKYSKLLEIILSEKKLNVNVEQ